MLKARHQTPLFRGKMPRNGVAGRVQKPFEATYKDVDKTNEKLRKALYLDAEMSLTDWSRDQPFTRSEAIAAAI